MKPVIDLETDYRVLSTLEENPTISQRQIAGELGMSLGKANYCLKALISAGLVKASNFKQSENKSSYRYLLTAKGIRRKSVATKAFLKRKMVEYDELEREISELKEKLRNRR